MALSKLNYVPGVSETATDEPLADTPVLNTWYNFRIGNYSHAFADVVLKQGAVALPAAAFELLVDTQYTVIEASKSAKTVYGMWRIVDAGYAGNATTISGENFASYLDNEVMERRLPHVLESTLQNIAGSINYDFPDINFDDVIFYSVKVINSNSEYINVPIYNGDVLGLKFAEITSNAGKARVTVDWATCDTALDSFLADANPVTIMLITK